MVFQMLSKLASTVPSDDIVRQRYRTLAAKQRLDYNAAMRQRVFGYEEKSAISSEQIETIRPISDALKTFLDHELLEDKIPDDFDAVAKFRLLISEIK